jgi:hypothetical protein
MGLLDDAIREHLDLKRARGADPAEVERLEREALGPVRREPTIRAAHFETPDHYDERLHQPEDLGYHDSTAPHAESHLEHPSSRLDLSNGHAQPDGVRTEADEEQPKRRFLRRSRPPSLPDPAEQTQEPDAPGLFEHHDLPDHLDLPQHDDLLEHHDPLKHHDVIAHDDLLEHDEPLEHEQATEQHQVAEPPHLQFDAPPARPRFTAEPPAATDPETVVPAEPESPAPAEPDAAHHDEPAPRQHEPQPTHEFDVPSTFHEEDPERDSDAKKGEEEADVLEETPEFLQDTPEHDRLWFEQHPPRDFDFDG